MSRLNSSLFCGKFRSRSLVFYGPRIAASILLLISALLTASCGLISQSEAGQRSGNLIDTLTLSGTFPGAVTNQAYNSVLTVSGGYSPYLFAIKSGSLPAGMSLNPTTGSVSGTPAVAGSYTFEVGVSDASQTHHGSQNFEIAVTSGQSGNGSIRVTVSPSSVNIVS